MTDKITKQEREAISQYRGPIQRIPQGKSGLATFIWNGWRLVQRGSQARTQCSLLLSFASTQMRAWKTADFAQWARLKFTTAFYRICVAVGLGLVESAGKGLWKVRGTND